MNLRRQFLLFLFLTVISLFISQSYGQVTIGSDDPPALGALLQLKDGDYGNGSNAKKGLGMPRVNLHSLGIFKIGTADEITDQESKQRHIGLVVYNMRKRETADRLCPGLHVWQGDKWEPLIPYPTWESQPGTGDTSVEFIYLDPSDTSNPIWSQIGKDPAQYKLGYMGQITDNRDNLNPEQYHYTRFYVGVRKISGASTGPNYSCDPVGGTIDTYEFVDGVWMAENLRATIMHPTRDKAGETIIPTIVGPQRGEFQYGPYQYGYLSSKSRGMFYTWAVATNGKNLDASGFGPDVTINEGGLNEGEAVQGICPPGWHLPSDKDWTELENGIIFKTSEFSTETGVTDNPSGPFISYDLDADHNASNLPAFGKAMRVHGDDGSLPPPLGGEGETQQTQNGYTKDKDKGGFADILAEGFPLAGPPIISPGDPEPYSTFWTSSVFPTTGSSGSKKYYAWVRNNMIELHGIDREGGLTTDEPNSQHYMRSVRCMRNQE